MGILVYWVSKYWKCPKHVAIFENVAREGGSWIQMDPYASLLMYDPWTDTLGAYT